MGSWQTDHSAAFMLVKSPCFTGMHKDEMMDQNEPDIAQEQGMMTPFFPDRRACLRWLVQIPVIVGLYGPTMALAKPGNKPGNKPGAATLLERHPWMQPWIEQDGMTLVQLQNLLGAMEPDPRVMALMDHQTEAKPYFEYRALLLNQRRIQDGRRMMKKHHAVLARVAEFYQVPAEFVVALWGIESDFGQDKGHFNVLRTLFTLSAHYSRRIDFFRNELREFLLLCKEEQWDPRLIKGSYAGAFGQVQMMPSTFRRIAVDFNLDGKRDVVHDVTDSLASIAAFLRAYGWCVDAPLIVALSWQPGLAEWFAAYQKINKPWREWRALGMSWPPDTKEPDLDASLALIILEERQGPRYYMTFKNFRVITQWNRSNRFAKVVQEFALDLRRLE
ncbi:MAG: lytic murein transglycosylase [Magnetococcus sp. YQC-5]